MLMRETMIFYMFDIITFLQELRSEKVTRKKNIVNVHSNIYAYLKE